MSITKHDVQTWRGQTVKDPSGAKIGTLDEIYLDRATGEPEWGAVRTGLFGSRLTFVPLEGASGGPDFVTVNYEKKLVKGAPNIDADGELSPDEERRLWDHYSRGGYTEYEGTDTDERFSRETVARDTSGPSTDDAMTRSEEELHVETERRETGRARLRKYVVTEDVQTTVPVQREEVRIEREPITDANIDQAMAGPEISEDEHEVTLHAEEPVVEKRTVPKERVRLEKETHVEDRTVTDQVRKERIEAEGDTDTRR